MFWSLAVCAGMVLLSISNVQPLVCTVDEQCETSYFCDNVGGCRKCLNCEELKREPLHTSSLSGCIKSVSKCGPCIKGLVINHQGDIDSACIRPASAAEGSVLPTYVWVLIVFAVIFAVLIIAAVVYVMRKKETIKMIAWTERSGPEPPPPYNPQYAPVRADSPAPRAPADSFASNKDQDTAVPFVKRGPYPTLRPAPESARNQEATMYNPPVYPTTPTEEVASELPPPAVKQDSGAPENVDDTNNNTNYDGGSPPNGDDGCDGHPSLHRSSSKPAFVINVVQINNQTKL